MNHRRRGYWPNVDECRMLTMNPSPSQEAQRVPSQSQLVLVVMVQRPLRNPLAKLQRGRDPDQINRHSSPQFERDWPSLSAGGATTASPQQLPDSGTSVSAGVLKLISRTPPFQCYPNTDIPFGCAYHVLAQACAPPGRAM
eukprot:4591151-Pyramimonas_sp.AAC.1